MADDVLIWWDVNRKPIALPVIVQVICLFIFDNHCIRIVHGQVHHSVFVVILCLVFLLLFEQVQLVLRFILLRLHQVDLVEVDCVFVEVPVRRVIASADLMLL